MPPHKKRFLIKKNDLDGLTKERAGSERVENAHVGGVHRVHSQKQRELSVIH
jgi:hypothetical protein